jgi:hypothetical protein
MKLALAVLSGALAVAAVAAALHASAAPASPDGAAQLYSPPSPLVQYGHIRSLVRRGGRFVLRFDPAFWLTGTTATRAAIEDKVIQPGEIVPNDHYIRDESKKLLTYVVPANARVTILTHGPKSTRITSAELAAIVQGRNPRRRALFDRGNNLGYWIGVVGNRVTWLDQQYQP